MRPTGRPTARVVALYAAFFVGWFASLGLINFGPHQSVVNDSIRIVGGLVAGFFLLAATQAAVNSGCLPENKHWKRRDRNVRSDGHDAAA